MVRLHHWWGTWAHRPPPGHPVRPDQSGGGFYLTTQAGGITLPLWGK